MCGFRGTAFIFRKVTERYFFIGRAEETARRLQRVLKWLNKWWCVSVLVVLEMVRRYWVMVTVEGGDGKCEGDVEGLR